ncbi:MAG TPA: dipeptidase [Vicinamibacteria bacterium]|nr:dipeptidase [Vicinamibacteria bacterium]
MNRYVIVLALAVLWACRPEATEVAEPEQPAPLSQRERAEQLAQELIIVDTHIDVPDRLSARMEDISTRTERGDFDYPRAKAGGLNVAFMSIYVAASHQETGDSKDAAERLIDLVEKLATDWPDKFSIATSVADVREQFAQGKISLAMGMENGAPIETLDDLRHFYQRGVRYITLAHSRANQLSDSSYHTNRPWSGLSPFGREVVAEMNRLGMMVDVSHISDDAFRDVMEVSTAPVIASHSSSRHFTPGFERNMSDDMVRALAANGGTIGINFGSSFLVEAIRQGGEAMSQYLEENGVRPDSDDGREYARRYRQKTGLGYADVSDVVAHIDRVVQLAGVDHVGLGSDFDGVGDSLPTGLKDVSFYPNLIYELLKAGYSEEDIAKICSANVLRVWTAVERKAAELQASQ